MLVISVKDTEGREVRFRAGAQSERDFIADVIERLKEMGVGVFRTETSVLTSVAAAINESLFSLKSDVIP